MKTAVLVNTAAGGGKAATQWQRLEPAMADFEILKPESAEDARRQLRGCLGDIDRLVIFGGDGTANLAVDVVLGEGRGDDVHVGLVPAGTGSDFARTLGLPRRPAAALRRLLAAEPRPIDAIEILGDSGRRRYCLNIASIGLSGAVDLAVNARSERGSYLLATLGALLRYEAKPCRVLLDGELLTDEPFFVIACANGRYFGKGMKVAPGAAIDDGLLDVVLVPPVPRWQLPWRLPQFLTGRHVQLPQVTVRRGKEVRVEPPPGFYPFDLDGETLDAEPATLRVLPGALRFLS